MWGSCNRAKWNSKRSGTVSDEDLQAQAWLPSCLRALLAEVSSFTFASIHILMPYCALLQGFQTDCVVNILSAN